MSTGDERDSVLCMWDVVCVVYTREVALSTKFVEAKFLSRCPAWLREPFERKSKG